MQTFNKAFLKLSLYHNRHGVKAAPNHADQLNTWAPCCSPISHGSSPVRSTYTNTKYFCTSVSVITLYSRWKCVFCLPEPFLRSLWLNSKTSDRGRICTGQQVFFPCDLTFRFGSSRQNQHMGSHRDQGEESTYTPVTPESSNKLHNLNVPPAKKLFKKLTF